MMPLTARASHCPLNEHMYYSAPIALNLHERLVYVLQRSTASGLNRNGQQTRALCQSRDNCKSHPNPIARYGSGSAARKHFFFFFFFLSDLAFVLLSARVPHHKKRRHVRTTETAAPNHAATSNMSGTARSQPPCEYTRPSRRLFGFLPVSFAAAARKFLGIFFLRLPLKFRVHHPGHRVGTQRAAEQKDVRLRPESSTENNQSGSRLIEATRILWRGGSMENMICTCTKYGLRSAEIRLKREGRRPSGSLGLERDIRSRDSSWLGVRGSPARSTT